MKKLMLILVCLTIVLLSSSTYAQNTKKSDAFKPGWYLGANGGVSWMFAEGNNFLSSEPNAAFSLIDNAGLTGKLAAGYQFTPVVGLRAMLGYTQNRWTNYMYSHNIQSFGSESLNADVLFNMSNLFKGYNPDRFVDFSLFAGLAADLRNSLTDLGNVSHDSYFNLPVRLGGQFDFRLADQWKLNLIGDLNFAPDNYNALVGGFGFDIFPEIALGVTYRLPQKESETPVDDKLPIIDQPVEPETPVTPVEPVKPVEPVTPVTPVVPEEPVKPTEPEKPAVQSAVDYLNEHFYFAINSTDVNSAEYEESMKVIADYVKKNPDTQIIIRGYADQGTGNVDLNNRISKNRAVNVANTLIRKYGVPYKAIWVRWYGGGVQPYIKNAKSNRLVIVHTPEVKELVPARTATDQKKKVTEDKPQTAASTVEAETEDNGTATVVAPVTKVIYFDEKALNPRDKNEEDKIMLVAVYLRNHPNAIVTVDGYADNVSDGENKSAELSKQRAINVANTLIRKYSIDKERVSVNWYGARPNAALNKMVLVKTSVQ